MNSKQIGNLGEAFTLAKFVELNIAVYQQFGDNEAADYIIIVNKKPLKVQVKTSTRSTSDCVSFNLCSISCHLKSGGRHIYSQDEVDMFVCFDMRTKQLFVIKNTGDLKSINFKYTPTKNNQIKKIRYAKDYLLCVETLYEISK